MLEIGGSRGFLVDLAGSAPACATWAAGCSPWRRTPTRPRGGAGTSPTQASISGSSSSRGTRSSRSTIDDVLDVVFLDAEKDDYDALFTLAREQLEPGRS